MYGFLYNDFRINKKSILTFFGIILAAIIIYLMPFIGEDPPDSTEVQLVTPILSFMYVLIVFMITDTICSQVITFDERKKWAYYITASEKGIKDFIAAKYFMVVIIANLVSLLAAAENTVVLDIMKDKNPFDCTSFLSMVPLAVVFIKAIELPFTFRFSSKYGNYSRVCIFGVILSAIYIYFLFGDLSRFGSQDDFWEKLLSWFRQSAGTDVVLITSIAGLLAYPLFYLSYRISCKVYLKGTEYYEK